MRIIEVTTEAIDPTGINTAVGNHTEALSKGQGNNKIIIEANTKPTTDNLVTPVEAIIIITMTIIKTEVVVDVAETISDLAVMEEAIIKAIIISNTINITHMMIDHRLNNMDHYAHFAVPSIILLNIALKGNMTSIISWRK